MIKLLIFSQIILCIDNNSLYTWMRNVEPINQNFVPVYVELLIMLKLWNL
jgi:hypothetical protein